MANYLIKDSLGETYSLKEVTMQRTNEFVVRFVRRGEHSDVLVAEFYKPVVVRQVE